MFSTGGELHIPIYNPKVPLKNKKPSFNVSVLHGFYNKIFKLTPEGFNTKEARKIAKKRYNFVESYVERFLKEWKGVL
jgi:HD superfamily phosphodiesterase